jgi:hypothetical protein
MDPALTQPYEHLLHMLENFACTTQSSMPVGPDTQRWSRATAHLAQELALLRSLSTPDALKNAATRLTQLARIQDGLRFEHSAAAPADQLLTERRLVVFAAWQLQQACEYAATLAGAK